MELETVHNFSACQKVNNSNASALLFNADAIGRLATEAFSDATTSTVTWKTLISAPQTSTESLTVGIATCPPAYGRLPCHRHTQSEVYHIISGQGIVSIDGVDHTVQAGSVIYIPGDAEHGVRNDHPEESLKWLYVFGTDSFADVKYRFSA